MTKHRGLVLYDQSSGLVELYSAKNAFLGRVGEIKAATGQVWSHGVAGTFYNTNFSGLMLYDAPRATMQIYSPWFDGRLFYPWGPRDLSISNLSWSHIVSMNITYKDQADDKRDLFFYDASRGVGMIYRVTETLIQNEWMWEATRVKIHRHWRTTWTHIVAGQFGGDALTDLLFYDTVSGIAEVYTVASDGSMGLLHADNWGKGWTHLVGGSFGGNGATDLLFYTSRGGEGFFCATNRGRLEPLVRHTNWRKSYTSIVAGDFWNNDRSALLFYDASVGTAEFYQTSDGRIALIRRYADWRRTWTWIASYDSELRGGGGF